MDGITDSVDMSLSKLQDGDGQGGLVCCTPWGLKEVDITEQARTPSYVSLSFKLLALKV